MKIALITGIGGQDGAYLTKFLAEKNYLVYGLNKRGTSVDNLKKLGVYDKASIIEGDITDPSSVAMAIKVSKPDEIYNLAAQSHVGYSFKAPQLTCSVNYMGFLNVLLESRRYAPYSKIYQAGTSEMFGYAATMLQNEDTPLQPKSPYAISKVAAHWAGVNARHEANQFVSNGILFNHESPLRGNDFVTKKIADGVKKIADGKDHIIRLGNIDSKRDWGHAQDYVEAMWMILQHSKPDDFVVATGNTRSVRDFIVASFNCVGMDVKFDGAGDSERAFCGNKLVMEIDKQFYRPNELGYLRGDYSKASSILGWNPKTSFKQLVEDMVRT